MWKAATQYHWVKETRGQLERGESGTLHIQGMIRTEPVAWTRVKKLFPRAHVERATNAFALERYVEKPETRVAALGRQVAPERKVITPVQLHQSLYDEVYRRHFHKGLPLEWSYSEGRGWTSDIWEYPDHWHTLQDWEQLSVVLTLNRRYMEKHADAIITAAVDTLILDGVLGAEYATAQVASRAALKRHLSSIVIRHERTCYEEAQRTQAYSQVSEGVEADQTGSE